MKVKIMNRIVSKKNIQRIKRKMRIRNKINGTEGCPRMSFFRSNKNILVQVIDDKIGNTLASISTYEKHFSSLNPTLETSKKLGQEFADRLKGKSISSLVFDRNGYKYHGLLKVFVDSIREAGIKI